MKLSKILQSKSIVPYDDCSGGSWGIFIYPEDPTCVIKLFHDEEQFDSEKMAYDMVFGEPSLMSYANHYGVISVQLDTSIYFNNRTSPPYSSALLIPFLSNPPWQMIGKLGIPETDEKLAKIGINVKELKENFSRIGVASWEVTIFVNSNSHEIKAIDFTYCDVVKVGSGEQ